MNTERMRRIAALVDELIDAGPPERDRRLAEACGDDAGLRAEVEALLGDAYAVAADAHADPAIAATAAAVAQMAFPTRAGHRVGAWVLDEEIGHGGMGAVYRAHRADGLYDATTAIKFLRRGLAQPANTKRFLAERQILASLTHPGIGRLLDGGTADDGSPFIVMELVNGRPIDRYCDDEGLALGDRIRLFLQVTDAVQHAHQSLVIHRDLKPSNILVTANGEPKLLDFGVAKLVGGAEEHETTGLGPLTPAFASPEQLRGLRPTVATDVYSLGLILFRLLTGRLAFDVEGSTPAEIERRITTEDPPRPSDAARGARPAFSDALAGDLDNILLMALRKEPERRYPSVEAFASDLRRYLEGLPVSARPATVRYRLDKFIRRHRTAVAGVALTVLAVVSVSLFYTRRLARERDTAEQAAQQAEAVTAFLQNLFTGADPTRTHGDSLTVGQVVDEGRARLDTALADQPRVRSRLLTTLGAVYGNIGRLDAADSAYEAALALSDSLDGPDAPLRAAILADLAINADNRGSPDRAGALLNEALRIQEHAGDSVAVIRVLGEMFLLLINQKHLDSARVVLDRMFAIYATQPSVDSVAYADLLKRRSNLEVIAGQFSASIKDARAAVELDQRFLRPDDPRLAAALATLSADYDRGNEMDSAAAVGRRALEITLHIFGPDHPLTARRLMSTGTEVAETGNGAEGLAMFKRGLAIETRLSGPDSLGVAHANQELGNIYQAMDSVEASLAYYRRADALYSRSTATRPTDRYYALYNLGVALTSLHRYAEAARYHRQGLAIVERAKLAVPTAISHEALAESLVGLDSTASAERHYRRSLAIIDSVAGPQNVYATYALQGLADLYSRAHRYAEAVPTYRRLVPLLKATRFKERFREAGARSRCPWPTPCG